MTWRWFLPLSFLLLLCQTSAVQGGLMVSLTSSATNLSQLTPGQSLQIDVVLSGLNAGDEVEFLATTITLPDQLFDTPPTITIRPAVPDATGILEFAANDLVDVNYDAFFALSGAPITENGVLFSFQGTVSQPMSGEISFSFVDSFGVNNLGDSLPILQSGDPLQVGTINPIPAPSTLIILLSGLVSCMATRTFRGRLLRRSGRQTNHNQQ